MSYAPVANFYSGRISRRALLAASVLATAPATANSTLGAQRNVIEGGHTYIKSGQGRSLRAAIVVGGTDATAFVTDGNGRAQLFEGLASRSVVLDSVDGSRLTASLRGETWDCWLTRPGTSTAVLSFRVEAVTGNAGLYRVEIKNGALTGSSGNGNTLAAGIAGSLPDGTLVAGGAITDAHGSAKPLAAFLSPDAQGLHWWIVQADGVVAGGCPDDHGYGYANSFRDLDPSGAPLIELTSCS